MKIFFQNWILKQLFTLFLTLIGLFTFNGCKKLVEVDPPINQLSSESVYSTDPTAIAVMSGVYAKMSNNGFRFVTGTNGISVLAGLSADELTLANGAAVQLVRYYSNRLTVSDDIPWSGIYSCLYTVNTAIEKLERTTGLTSAIRQQLIGEAKFMRAFCYYYLVNFYGDVPLVLTSDYRVNSNISRSSKSVVYDQMIKDLKDAQDLLSPNYLDVSLKTTTQERVRPTKWAATALLARVYLFKGDWSNAELQATTIINNTTDFSLSTPDKAFLKASLGNKEAIWQLQPTNTGWNTEDAKTFVILRAPGSSQPVFLDTFLVKSFETGDARKSNWIKDTTIAGKKYWFANKYKLAKSNMPVNEYLMVFRFAEQYLIRAEARAQLNNLNGAISDLDKIRQRAMLPLISVTNPGISLGLFLDSLIHERRVELFTEWGHRWLDLKRTNKVDAVMSVVTARKGGTWNPNWALYPIPFRDMEFNTSMTQNPGY